MAKNLSDLKKISGVDPITKASGMAPVIAEMHSQNERGAAITGGIFLEDRLRLAIERQWPPISNTMRDKLFTGFGPLAS
jgi:hypothetical protein